MFQPNVYRSLNFFKENAEFLQRNKTAFLGVRQVTFYLGIRQSNDSEHANLFVCAHLGKLWWENLLVAAKRS